VTDAQKIEAALDYYVDHFSEQSTLMLLKALAYPSQGGFGYRIEMMNPLIDMDGYEVDENAKVIKLDRTGLLSSYHAPDLAKYLKDAIEIDVYGTRRSLMYRVGWGTGKVVLGAVETAVGVIGILVPEPGTTVGGVALTVLGANTVADGLSQLAGANSGEGFNPLAEGAGWAGSNIAGAMGGDPALGERIGEAGFYLGSLAVGTVGAIRILRVPGKPMLRMGVGGQPGGLSVGRVDLWYGIPVQRALRGEQGALTILSINNNQSQSILRFVIQFGRLYVNGRIVGVQKVLVHESNWRVVVKGLLKLLWHGAKTGM
jgi:hypothetical protein